ncbi:MAG: phage tail assembly protein [Isosphaeraceae bacterium]
MKVALSDGTEIVLRNLLRLSKKGREDALKALDDLNNLGGEDGTSVEEVALLVESAEDIIKLIAGKGGDRLVAELDGDVQLLMKLLETWMGSTQPGEAQNSPA